MAEKKPILIDFYTTWCPSCNGAAAAMGKLHANSGGKYITLLICIERDMNQAKTEAFGKKNSIGEIPHYFAQAPQELGLQYIPHKTLIGADGKIIKNGTWSLD